MSVSAIIRRFGTGGLNPDQPKGQGEVELLNAI